jgi:hypothetical protein
MRFHEPDVREGYRRGARECFEAIAARLKPRDARVIEKWLSELDVWDEDDPPPPPLLR